MLAWLALHSDLILKIISTAATVTIGVAASILAYQQFKISKSKLRFDLYEKRLKLFMLAREYTSSFSRQGNNGLETLDVVTEFYHDTLEAHFLFDEDVSNYFKELVDKGNELSHAQMEFLRPNLTDDERQQARNSIVVIKDWLFHQPERMFDVFKKDLSIKTLR